MPIGEHFDGSFAFLNESQSLLDGQVRHRSHSWNGFQFQLAGHRAKQSHVLNHTPSEMPFLFIDFIITRKQNTYI